jgi:hypothetical protein
MINNKYEMNTVNYHAPLSSNINKYKTVNVRATENGGIKLMKELKPNLLFIDI